MEIDPVLKSSLKLLHSTSAESAEKIRLSLDEILKQKYGVSKMLVSTLNKKFVAEEKNFPTIKIIENEISSMLKAVEEVPSEEENLNEFGDLVCVVCSGIGITAGNRLVECCDCHSLYHQECHKIKISDDDANNDNWSCNNCKSKSENASEITIPSKSPSPCSSSSEYKNSSSHSKKTSHSSSKHDSEKKTSTSKKKSKHHDSKRKK